MTASPPVRERRRQPLPAAYRWQVTARCLAAAVGGFALASAFGILLAQGLVRGGVCARGPAVQAATLVAFAVWCAAAMWAVHVRSPWRSWLDTLLPAAGLAALAWLLDAGH
jgi:hypothetical protein